MGPTWAQEASKPAPGALRDASSTAKDPSRGAKKLPRASRDSPKLDFDPSQGRLGVGFDPPGGSKRLKNCSYAVPQVTATAAAIAFPNCRVGGCSRQRLQSADPLGRRRLELHIFPFPHLPSIPDTP